MSGEWIPLAGRGGLRWFVDKGWEDDEILDWLSTRPYPGDDGEVLRANTLRGKRVLQAMLAEVRGVVADEAGSEDWQLLRSRYLEIGGRPTMAEVARKMDCSESTVRRIVRAAGIRHWRYVHARIVR